MKEAIEDIRRKLQNNEYKNKEHIRISLVGRILHNLGWNLWNPGEFFPDFSPAAKGDNSQVAVALFASPPALSVLIDIKPMEIFEQNISSFEKMLSVSKGEKTAAFSILTDGKRWRFYFTQTDEKISNQCFEKFDIIEDNIDVLATSFEAYLSKNRIIHGKAQHDAKQHLLQGMIVKTVNEALPQARLLVNEPPYPRLPQAVVQLVAQKGFKVAEEDVIKLLKKNGTHKPASESSPVPPSIKKPSQQTAEKKNDVKKEIKSYIFLGKKYGPSTWKELLVTACEDIYKSHSSEFHKCLHIGSDTQLYFSKDKKDLEDHDPVPIGNSGYYVMTDFNGGDTLQLVQRLLVIFGYNQDDIKIPLG